MVSDGKLERVITDRYAGWKSPLGESILGGKVSLKDLSDQVLSKGINPRHRSGQQEFLENLVNRYL
jgi:xylose isomerase